MLEDVEGLERALGGGVTPPLAALGDGALELVMDSPNEDDPKWTRTLIKDPGGVLHVPHTLVARAVSACVVEELADDREVPAGTTCITDFDGHVYLPVDMVREMYPELDGPMSHLERVWAEAEARG